MPPKKKKSNRGGKRAGAGRKQKQPTDTITLRHNAEDVKAVKAKYGRGLQKLGKEWIDGLIKKIAPE